MDQQFQEKLTTFMDTTTKGLKELGEKSDREITAIRQEIKDEGQRTYDKVRERNVSVPGSELPDNGKKFSFARAALAIATRDFSEAPLEKEVFEQSRKRSTATTMTGAAMGYLVPTEPAREVLQPAMANIAMQSLGVTTYTDLVGELPFPDITSRPTLSWVREAAAASETGVSVGEKVMRPKTGSMLVKLSNKLNYQSQGTAEQIVREKMTEGAALGIDRVSILGSGSSSEPLGIMNVAGIGSAAALGSAGGRLTIDRVASMMADLEDLDFNPTGLLTAPRVISGLKRERVQQFTGQGVGLGQPIIQPLMTDEMVAGMLGIKFAKTTQIPKNGTKSSSSTLAKAILGAWKEFKIGLWGGMSLRSSDVAGNSFVNNELYIVMFVDMDTLCAKPTAFTMISDCETLEANWTY